MKKPGYLLMGLLMLIPLVNSGCGKLFRVEGNHHVVTQNRAVDAFNEIDSEGEYVVIFNSDSIFSLHVEAESNLLPYIKTSVHNGTLKIKTLNNRNLKNHSPLKVYVKAPWLSYVSLSGSGSISCDSVSNDNIKINLSGSGKINIGVFCQLLKTDISGSGKVFINGKTDQSELKVSGSGEIYAFNLIQNSCYAKISGSGSIYVYVMNYLDVNISGSGKVYYSGDPVVHSDITGSGEVIKYI